MNTQDLFMTKDVAIYQTIVEKKKLDQTATQMHTCPNIFTRQSHSQSLGLADLICCFLIAFSFTQREVIVVGICHLL